MAKLQLILENVGGGSFFLGSGREHPDHYRFEQLPGLGHLVAITIDGKDIGAVSRDILALYGMPETQVEARLIFDAADAEAAAEKLNQTTQAELTAAMQSLDAQKKEIEALRAGLAEAKKAPAQAEGGQRITDDELAFLGERDRMLALMMPLAFEYETPLDCLERIVTNFQQQSAEGGSSNIPDGKGLAGDTAPAFDEPARKAELLKLKPAAIRKLAKGIDGTEEIKEIDQLVEAILIHEASEAAKAA